MRRILLIPRIKVQNANSLSSPFTIGFPAMTAWLGAVHALQRKVNGSGFKNIRFKSVAVVCHEMNLMTYKGVGDYIFSIVGTGNPLVEKKKRKKGEPWEQFERPPFIEEGRCHLVVSLAIETEGFEIDEEERFFDETKLHLISGMKIASGDILNFSDPEMINVSDEKAFKKLIRKLMPGYAIIERRDLMTRAMIEEKDSINAMLEYLKIMHRSKKNEDETVTWTSSRKEKGWIVPIATGFHGITDLGYADNQRDPNTPHRFAESVVTLGEFIMPYRINDLNRMLWETHVEYENNLYLCQQKDRNY